ncbi:MAG: virulence RhuM family protein [Alphaproteobacteria bacterium]|nr:virulence RhuM family protein [Alphaproteobacteria bacterium]
MRKQAIMKGADENQGKPIIFYTTPQGKVRVNLIYDAETFWLPQDGIANLFGVGKAAISKHLKNIFSDGELTEPSVVSKMETTASDGKHYQVSHYNLDAIIAVGYRVNSKQATQFRVWATQTLKEYITKGFVLNDEMLKNGRPFGRDYFNELLERIREIRASERRAYQKITDLFEQCSADYSADSDEAHNFFAFVQNKLHFAIAGKTAAEIVYSRANAEQPTMGLTTWKNAPKGKMLRSDTHVAKNYLNQKEVDKLNRLVVMFIDFAELRALDHKLMLMKEWATWVDKFLDYSDQQILQATGKISHDMAIAKANREYDIFRVRQDHEFISDFDKSFAKYLTGQDDK